jgi:hypothetical protein
MGCEVRGAGFEVSIPFLDNCHSRSFFICHSRAGGNLYFLQNKKDFQEVS